MERNELLRMGSSATDMLALSPVLPAQRLPPPSQIDMTFVQNWLSRLVDTVGTELDEPARTKPEHGCGQGCPKRSHFKQDVAAQGGNSIEELITALRDNFELWRDGDKVHVRYGPVNKNGGFCPAAYSRPEKPGETDCDCTCTCHQTIPETSSGRPVEVEIVQKLERGDPVCQLLVHLTY